MTRSRPSLPLVAVAATAASRSARTRTSGPDTCSNFDYPRPMSVPGGSLTRGIAVVGGTRATSPTEPSMTSPALHAVGANVRRTDTIREKVLGIVIRLTERMLAPSFNSASRDSYVFGIRKAIGKKDALPVQMIAAIAYDDVMHQGRPASEVKAWMLELCEEIDAWEAERLGQRIQPPDLMPALRLESRREGAENEASLVAASDQDNPDVLEKLITVHEAEIDASEDVVELARRRLTVLRRQPVTA